MTVTNESLVIISETPLYEYEESLKHNKNITFIRQNGFSGVDSDFLALVTLSGVAIKAISEVVLAMIRKNEKIEIKLGDKTIKGLSYEKAKSIFDQFYDNQN